MTRRTWRGLAAGCFALALMARAARAEENAPPPAKISKADQLGDPIAQIEGSSEAWSVSSTELGCFLMSAYRKGSSRLAIGRHQTLGLGLFAIRFGLSLPRGTTREPVVVETEPPLKKQGSMAANMLLVVPLEPAEVQASLLTLATTGALWLDVRNVAIAHGGKDVADATAAYKRICADRG